MGERGDSNRTLLGAPAPAVDLSPPFLSSAFFFVEPIFNALDFDSAIRDLLYADWWTTSMVVDEESNDKRLMTKKQDPKPQITLRDFCIRKEKASNILYQEPNHQPENPK
ncbi:hypothetical protein C4D60_Mb05t02700 [Musa balbisiana]|uniref:Uncharacterized protein n=1 Tax=Musa balbisiana TaxID=52838 RepID=A0A4S8JT83_MUSBA|nr:hypothetical protein C4D60_Mb05t02700 [Musa balbisiana]